MKFKLNLIKAALLDTKKAAEYYKKEGSEALAAKFQQDLRDNLQRLKEHPNLYAQYLEDIRKGNLDSFPYSFFYIPETEAERVDILAVLNQYRDPKLIEKELKKRKKTRK
jgi:plasmid stabilization system protein ParE